MINTRATVPHPIKVLGGTIAVLVPTFKFKNGYYYHGSHVKSLYRGINWEGWKGHSYSAKRAEMKIRPVDF